MHLNNLKYNEPKVHNNTELKVLANNSSIEPMVQDEKAREEFSKRLALACKYAGLDEHGRGVEIAKHLDVTPKAVSKWLNAEALPRAGKMEQLSKYLKVSKVWLQLGEGSSPFSEQADITDEIRYPDFAERLNSLMTDKGVDVNTLKDISGVSYEMARRYTLGAAKPRDDRLEKIAQFFNVTMPYLDYGIGVTPSSMGDSEKLEQLEVYASAGKSGYINRDFPEVIRSIEIPKERIYELFGRKSLEGIRIMNVDGDSMMPTLNPRDLLFIDARVDHFNGDGIYVFCFEDATFVKRLQRVKGRRLAVISDNDRYPPFTIEENEMFELYIFGKLIKQLPMKFIDYA